MRRFFARALLFLAGLAGVFVLTGIYHELRVRQTDDFFRQVAWFRNPAVKPVVLLIGDSRMAMNIDPRRLPTGFYNFSYPGETLRHFYLRAKFALETKPSIRYLVIGLEDLSLSEARARLREVSRQMLFADLADLAEVYPPSPRFLLRSAMLHYLPLVNATQRGRTAEALVSDVQRLFAGHAPKPPTELVCGGFRFTEERQWTDRSRQERETQAIEDIERLFGRSTDDPEMRAVFAKILDLAQRHGVKAIGVRNPVSRAYRAAAKRYDVAAVFAFFNRSPLHAMLNYETLFGKTTAYFFDADHLNNRGAARFTDRLVHDLRRLVSVDENVPAPCDVAAAIEPADWPYNDVLSAWLGNPACRNLRGDCGKPLAPPQSGREYADHLAADDQGVPFEATGRHPVTSRPRLLPRRHDHAAPFPGLDAKGGRVARGGGLSYTRLARAPGAGSGCA